MTARCENCGYSSANSFLFRGVAADGPGPGHDYCGVCAPTPRRYSAFSLLIRSFLNIAIFGSIGFTAGWIPGLHSLLAAFVAIATFPLSVLAHELGHAATGRLVGLDIGRIRIGGGRVRWARRFGRRLIEWRGWGYDGGHVLLIDDRLKPSRWRSFVMIAAGPLVNLSLAVVFISVCGILNPASFQVASISTISCSIFAGLAVREALTGFGAFWPVRVTSTGTPNDGAQLWSLLWRRRTETEEQLALNRIARVMAIGRFDDGLSFALDAARRWPRAAIFLSFALHCALRCEGSSAAWALFVAHRSSVDALDQAPGAERDPGLGLLHLNAAWAGLTSLDSSLEAEIVRELDMANHIVPTLAETICTTSAWRLANGDICHPIEDLALATRRLPDLRDKADMCLFLARASESRGKPVEATQYRLLRDHLLAVAWP